MLPDFLAPYKHYQEEVICDSVDDRIDPDESDDRPSTQSVKRWKDWIMLNADDINGHLKSIGYRILGFGEGLLRSGDSLLLKLQQSIPEGWLKAILRLIYNSGGFLRPLYG